MRLLGVAELRAQVIDLMCKGPVIQYEPKKIDGIASDGGTRVDLDQKRITAPVGEFRITKIEDTTIYFDDPKNALARSFGFGRGDRDPCRRMVLADGDCKVASVNRIDYGVRNEK